MKRKTTEQFIEEAKLVHGDRYDYSLVDYIGAKTKIKIICPEHGIFEQLSNSHLVGTNCHVCGQKNRSKSRTKTTDKFVEDAKKVHGNKYDYSLTEYIGESKKVKIICSKHGLFEQTASRHLKGNICYKCSVENKISPNTKDFIIKAKKVHGDKYDYSLVNYVGSNKNIKIICSIHGIFEQKPSNHLTGYCCAKCNKAYKLTTDDFIIKAKKVHGDKYDYSLSIYVNNRKKIKIICPIHGEFEQLAANHLARYGCNDCFILSCTTTLDQFLDKAKNIHKNKYDYTLVNYKNNETKVKIICPIHGIFEQTPNAHISQQHGCPICKESRGEKEITVILEKININFKREHRFNDCKNINTLPFDFYLPNYNCCIEFDGKQHYEPNDFFGGIKNFNKLIRNDKIKTEYCKNNNIRLIRIKYDDNIYDSINNELIKFSSFDTVNKQS